MIQTLSLMGNFMGTTRMGKSSQKHTSTAAAALHRTVPFALRTPAFAQTALRLALLLLLLLLQVTIVAASTSTAYYSKMTVSASPTGAGTVYVNTADKFGASDGAAESKTQNSTVRSWASAPSHTYYVKAIPNTGYVFSKWTGSSITFGSATTAQTSAKMTASSKSSGSPTTLTATANFTAVQATAAPANITLSPTDPSLVYPINTAERTLTFTSTASNALTDFSYSPANGASGKFTLANWRRVDTTHVAVDYTFKGNGTYGGLNRTNNVDITLKGVADATTQKCTITANFPNATITDGSANEINATFKTSDASQADKESTAVFDVQYVDGINNFDTPTFSGINADKFTYKSMSYADQKLTVTFAYNGNKQEGVHTADLTLKVNDAIGGTDATNGKKSVTIIANNEVEADYDVEVLDTNGNLVKDGQTTWAKGLDMVKANYTLRLVRDIDLGTITATNNLSKAMTIDLNGKTIKAAVNKASTGVLTITAAVAVTIKDSRGGGKILNEIALNGELRTIFVNKAGATLNIEGGTISTNNTMQYRYGTKDATDGVANVTSVAARTIHQVAGSTVNVKGGKIYCKSSRSGYGIVQDGSAATQRNGTTVLNMTGGEIYAECSNRAYGVSAKGVFNLSGGTITAKLNTETVNANTVYVEKNPTQTTYSIHNYAYGVLITGGASVTATSNYYGVLNMIGGEVIAINDNVHATATTSLHTYGICINAGSVNVKTGTASDGTYSQKWAAIGNITGGSVKVDHKGTLAYGVMVLGEYNSMDNTHKTTTIKNLKVDVSAYQSAYGIYATASVGTTSNSDSPNMGACYAGDVELTNCTVNAKTTTGTTAYALYVNSTSGTVYKNATIKTSYSQVYHGEFAAAAKMVVNSGKYTATAATTTAYAVGSPTRSKTTFSDETSVAANKTIGGRAEAYATLIIHGGEFRGETGTSTSGAVQSGGNTTIDGGTFEAYSGTTTSRGIYVTAGTLKATNVKVSSSANSTAYGIDLGAGISDYTGFCYAADAELNNLDVTAEARGTSEADAIIMEVTKRPLSETTYNALSATNKTTYGAIYNYGEYAVGSKAVIIGGTYTATATTATAYGVRMNSCAICEDVNGDGQLAIGAAELTVKNATFNVKAKGGKTAYGMWAGGPATIDNSTFTVSTSAEEAWGVRARYGKTVISNSTIDVTAGTATARAIYVDALMSSISTANHTTHYCGVQGYEIFGEAELNGNNVITANAKGGNTSYAIFVNAAKGAATQTTNDKGLAFAGDHAVAAKATVNGGKYTATASGTTAYAICLAAQQNQNGVIAQPEVVVNGGKFWGKATDGTDGCVNTNGKTGHFTLKGGYYLNNTNLGNYVADDKFLFSLPNTVQPEYGEGYRYVISDENPSGEVCRVYSGTTNKGSFGSLVEALQYVNAPENINTELTIVMTAHHTLPAGDYVLPAKATLLVPYKSGTGAGGTSALATSVSRINTSTAPSVFKKLIFASGANLTVKGKIETSAEMLCASGGAAVSGNVTGPYGQILLSEGSHIDLEPNAILYAWGYITGDGIITAKKGSIIYENFVLGYWRGGSASYDMMGNSAKAFFVTDYAYQNIECTVEYRAGATAYGYSGVYAASGIRTCNNVGLVGTSNALFLMDATVESVGAWVRKEYNAAEDRVYWTMNSGASISNMKITLSNIPWVGTIDMDSKDYNLPITSNFTITMIDGRVNITNDVLFMPGSQLIINKEATAVVASGKKLYFYDADDWQKTGGKWYYPVTYSPSWGNSNPRVAKMSQSAATNPLPDAEVFVHGSIEVNGQLFTTGRRDATLANGSANIHSTNEDAGTIVYTQAATADGTVGQCTSTSPDYVTAQTTSARLKNGDGTYTVTSGTRAGYIFEYENDKWVCRIKDGCMTKEIVGTEEHLYAKPSEVVEVVANTTDEAWHAAKDASRYFIFAENTTKNDAPEKKRLAETCQWWEAEHKGVIDGVNYYMANNTNYDNYGTYYYYDSDCGFWKPKTVTITWKNYDGTVLQYSDGKNAIDEVPFNTSPTFLAKNPSRSSDATYEYAWTGWRIEGDETNTVYDKYGTMPIVTTNTTFIANIESNRKQYTITFKRDDGSQIETKTFFAEDKPQPTVCPPIKPATVEWEYEFAGWQGYGDCSSLPNVVNTATYTANFTQVKRTYSITFLDYDAKTVLEEKQVVYNSSDYTYTGAVNGVPYRESTAAFSYDFKGWKGKDGTEYVFNAANKTYSPALPAVNGAANYTAVYTTATRRYKVTFDAQGGTASTPIVEVEYDKALSSKLTALPTATREGFVLKGWFTTASGGTQITLSQRITDDITFYAQWTAITYKYIDPATGAQTQQVGGAAPSPSNYQDEDYEYAFDDWDINDDGTIYTAQYERSEREYGDLFDVIDWTDEYIEVNTNGLSVTTASSSAWKIKVGSVVYTSANRYKDENGQTDRTLRIARQAAQEGSGYMVLKLQGTAVESRHLYRVPLIVDASRSLTSASAEDVIYVHDGATLTVSGNITVRAIYVSAGGELKIGAGKTLTVGKLVLKTEGFGVSVLTNEGVLSCTEMYYSRVSRSNALTYPFGLPFDVNLSTTVFSHGGAASHGKHYALMEYDAQGRAQSGMGGNWNVVSSGRLVRNTGYTFISGSKYYYEIMFPVDYSSVVANNASVVVKNYSGAGDESDQGWNYICSPYTSVYQTGVSGDNPEDALKIAVLNDDNETFSQIVAESINPASAFYYQASEDGELLFASGSLQKRARSKGVADSGVRTQWLQLNYGGGVSGDVVNIYVHPDKFSEEYERGYDVLKMSKSGSMPLIYSSVSYGDMAFAALPDRVLEEGVGLTVYNSVSGLMVFSLEQNGYLDRLDALYLLDKELGERVDLLQDDYEYYGESGTQSDRFVLQGVLRKQVNQTEVVTGMEDVGESAWYAYSSDGRIVVEGIKGDYIRCYNALGQLFDSGYGADRLVFEVGVAGVYYVQSVSGETRKVIVK